ncbi:hypothetical protein H5410_044470 [Solanum commersonii]|uniref:Calmodulin binding protein n=1 Tax=Solanum commersonii TaxID=4109 RepID=A0A9J5X9Z3_SOLCO|nr:hypothetical protein H5410_044470 [Solanum commersonii]
MEVETTGVSNFDLNNSSSQVSSIAPYRKLIDMSACKLTELRIPDFRSSDDMPELEGFGSPVSAGVECENGMVSFPASPSVSENGGRECDFSESVEKTPSNAAKRLQKVYRSYRTRRMLADSAVVAEELWWQAIDYARLNHSTISFFDYSKPETAVSRWNRVGLNASKVGKGLSKDAEAQILAFQHWIEAIDPRHRYGHNMHIYYEEWCKTDAGQPFFFWLDLGDGRKVDLKECPRAKLQKQCIKYLGPQERQHYEYIIAGGQILHKLTGSFLDTTKGPDGQKWIFVMSTSKRLYAGEKKKGMFHHSSFLAGGAALAAGRLVVQDGTVKSISPYSGHYRPSDDSLETFLSILQEHGVNVDEVEIKKANEDYDTSGDVNVNVKSVDKCTPKLSTPPQAVKEEKKESIGSPQAATSPTSCYQRTLSGGLHSPRTQVPKTAILERINSKKSSRSYQLGHQLSRVWSTGAGPRIGCIADYPAELRWQALELTNVSPKPSPSSTPRPLDALCSPTCSSPVFNNVLVKSS